MQFIATILLGILLQINLIRAGNFGPLTLPNNKDYEPLPPNNQKPNLQFVPLKEPMFQYPSTDQGKKYFVT